VCTVCDAFFGGRFLFWAYSGLIRFAGVIHHNATFRYFLMVSTFDFRFQKEKCAIWLGFVFLRSTSLILDVMRLKIQTRPKFVWVIFEMYYSAILSLYFQFLTIRSRIGFLCIPSDHTAHLINVNCDIYFSVGFFRLFCFDFIYCVCRRQAVVFWLILRLSSSSCCFLVNFKQDFHLHVLILILPGLAITNSSSSTHHSQLLKFVQLHLLNSAGEVSHLSTAFF
jgi:hypothetical protein